MPTTYDPGDFPGPLGGDPADGPAQISALATRLAAISTGLSTAQRDALAGDDLWTGRRVWNITTGRLEVWDGDSWEPVADLSGHTAASDPHTGYIRKALATAKGDLLVATASGVVVRKAVGANGRVLTADSAQSDGLSWTDLSGTYLEEAVVTAKGQILVGVANADVGALNAGSDGEVLVANATPQGGISWRAVPQTASVSTGQTTTSTSYTDLTTVGPAASTTVPPSGKVRVTVSCALENSGAERSYMSFADGSAASDPRAVQTHGTGQRRYSKTTLLTGLTPGDTYTATAKYRVVSGTGTFADREIIVEPA